MDAGQAKPSWNISEEQVESFTFGVSQIMLKFGECFNLSRENLDNSTHEVIKIDDVGFVNEDGTDSVPSCNKFNGLVLHNGNENE